MTNTFLKFLSDKSGTFFINIFKNQGLLGKYLTFHSRKKVVAKKNNIDLMTRRGFPLP